MIKTLAQWKQDKKAELEKAGGKAVRFFKQTECTIGKHSFTEMLFTAKTIPDDTLVNTGFDRSVLPDYTGGIAGVDGVVVSWYHIPKGKRKEVHGYSTIVLEK